MPKDGDMLPENTLIIVEECVTCECVTRVGDFARGAVISSHSPVLTFEKQAGKYTGCALHKGSVMPEYGHFLSKYFRYR